MPSWTKIAIGTGIGAGLIGAGIGIRRLIMYGKGMTQLKAEVQTIVKASIHSLKLDGLTIRVDVKVQNPTRGTLKMKFPYINIFYNDTMIGSSQVINQDVVLPQFGEAEFNGIMVNIPIIGMLTLTGAIADLVTKKQEVPILIKVLTPIDLGWKMDIQEQTHKINLKPGNNAS